MGHTDLFSFHRSKEWEGLRQSILMERLDANVPKPSVAQSPQETLMSIFGSSIQSEVS